MTNTQELDYRPGVKSSRTVCRSRKSLAGKGHPAPRPEPLSAAAHDLREVATALSNALQVVRLVAGGDPDVIKALRLALRQVPELARLADRLEGCARLY